MNRKVYVDNLAAATTENDLKKLFSPYGNVTMVNIAVERIGHKPRGFGFVNMATSEGARAAIRALHGKEIGTHNLIASEAWLHEECISPPGGAGIAAAVPALLTQPPLEGTS
jgi:cold-inducible RNA-binding protein